MSKKGSGFFTLITGIAAGAAAVFLSKEENRQLAKKELTKAVKTAKSVESELKKNPTAFKKKVVKKAVKAVKKSVRKSSTKKTVTKKTKSAKTTKKK